MMAYLVNEFELYFQLLVFQFFNECELIVNGFCVCIILYHSI